MPRGRGARGRAPGEHERLLDRVLGAVLVPEDERAVPIQARKRGPDQGGERLVVTRLRSRDELMLHVGTDCDAAQVAAFTGYEYAPAKRFPRRIRTSGYGREVSTPVRWATQSPEWISSPSSAGSPL